jgi:hypothetical protein
VISAATVAATGEAPVSDEEWFGEGSAFDSGEDLAAALFALAGATQDEIPVAEPHWSAPDPVTANHTIFVHDNVFEEVQRPGSLDEARRPGSFGNRAATPASRSWSVRSPGEQLLPPTVSGRSGWTIRNSVAVLHRTEDAIAKLREEAVAMAFLAAAEACGRGRPSSLERRRHPR